MIISAGLVEKLAHLARLGLSSEEIVKFADQLNEIMTFFKKLQEVDTTGINPVSQITGLPNISRKDIPHECDFNDALLQCSPQGIIGRHVRVQKTI